MKCAVCTYGYSVCLKFRTKIVEHKGYVKAPLYGNEICFVSGKHTLSSKILYYHAGSNVSASQTLGINAINITDNAFNGISMFHYFEREEIYNDIYEVRDIYESITDKNLYSC